MREGMYKMHIIIASAAYVSAKIAHSTNKVHVHTFHLKIPIL